MVKIKITFVYSVQVWQNDGRFWGGLDNFEYGTAYFAIG